ncbi:hypothetical protein C8R44DRAFT_725193 [Mycena epipterygia]|nr:hypothetical protein C8R44DRAFT_725193 [Mycena epipterygia]
MPYSARRPPVLPAFGPVNTIFSGSTSIVRGLIFGSDFYPCSLHGQFVSGSFAAKLSSILILVLLCAYQKAKATLFQAANSLVAISYTNTEGGYPSVPNDSYCTFGHVMCGMHDNTDVVLSNDTRILSFFDNDDVKVVASLVLNAYLTWDAPTGAELYTFYCTPGLTKGPTHLIKAAGTYIVRLMEHHGGGFLFQYNTRGWDSTMPDRFCWAAKPGGQLTLQRTGDKPRPDELFAFVFEPVATSPDPAGTRQYLVDNNRQVKGQVLGDDPCADMLNRTSDSCSGANVGNASADHIELCTDLKPSPVS